MGRKGIFLLKIVLLCFANEISSQSASPRVETPLGTIEGTVHYSYTGKPYFQFEGVPYAQPPVDYLRFEKPREPKKWEGILKATVRTLCYQYSEIDVDYAGNYTVVGDEDCLYYNVYTPTLNQSANLDVMVHIHGGAFMFGSGGEWRPDIILNRPIVLVTINYRLGPLGFISTEDKVLPGNLGLRDQQMALRQIKKRIKYFGGNPNSITLHGLSAGSASVQFHFILPDSKGLFHRGVGESGTVLNNWVLMEKPLEKARKLASLVGCPTKRSTQLKKCLKSKPARLIAQSVREFQPFLYNPFSPWAAVVDGYWTRDSVLPDHPLKLLLQKKVYDVPFLTSFVTSEGLYNVAEFYRKDEYLATVDARWNELLPHILMYNDTVDHRVIDRVSQRIRREYIGNSPLNRTSFFGLVQATSDRNFVADIEKGLRLHSASVKSPVYGYVYNYRGAQSVSELMSGSNENLGVSHGDDTILIVKQIALRAPYTPEDIAMSNLLLDMIQSFIRNGAPNISSEWKPISKNVSAPLNLLKINRYDDLENIHPTVVGNRYFWESLPIIENEKLFGIDLNF